MNSAGDLENESLSSTFEAQKKNAKERLRLFHGVWLDSMRFWKQLFPVNEVLLGRLKTVSIKEGCRLQTSLGDDIVMEIA